MKITTSNKRFPTDFGRYHELNNVQEVKVRFENGVPSMQKLRVEKSRKDIRFAICEWTKCMKLLGLENGRNYRVSYLKEERVKPFSLGVMIPLSIRGLCRYTWKTSSNRMASNQVVLVKNLKARKSNMTVKVKIASLWRLKMNGTENQTYRIDMILMDQEGCFIYANCHHRFLDKFQEMLNVDGKIYITNPFIAKDDNKQYVDNDLKMSLNDKTTMKKCLDWEGPKFGFNFVNFKTVYEKTLKHATKVGYVGKKNGLKSPKINFKLRNLDGVEIDASLWEDKAIALSSYMSKEDRDPYVFVLVQFGAINNFHGVECNMSVQNRFEASRVFINEDVEELITFKNKYLKKYAENESSQSSNSTTGSYMISNVEDAFLNNADFIPIVSLRSRLTVQAKFLIDGGANFELKDSNEEDNMSSTNPKESEVFQSKNISAEQNVSHPDNTEDDVYEVEGPSSIAATKRKILNDEDKGPKNKKFKLLIPKIEK
ncbi:hypothetical protein M8C21_026876 [Ambrosia artemisiifolia]|uniref:Replication protein A 70 kDa DNA-binding subunit B/D first OB fold domain-containing protein n=1 Tax=Ambrosia artemisiifolia TaxID=4212 RepID=A0AAD5BXU3_AMBAR|nr:hypothetical protein M8C21_026876 [Ambrosia artemisiifolia]